MEKDELMSIITSLSEKREFFYSEDDFKLNLSLEIKDKRPEYEIILEMPIEITYPLREKGKQKKSNAAIDIILKKENLWIPIELKYKTKKLLVQHNFNKEYFLKNQSAYPESRFRFRRDIFRIEKLKNGWFSDSKVKKGYSIFLTNDPRYWTEGNNSKTNCDKNYLISSSVSENDLGWFYKKELQETLSKYEEKKYIAKSKKLHWTCKGDNHLLLKLEKEYQIEWNEYSKVAGSKRSNTFKYCIVEI